MAQAPVFALSSSSVLRHMSKPRPQSIDIAPYMPLSDIEIDNNDYDEESEINIQCDCGVFATFSRAFRALKSESSTIIPGLFIIALFLTLVFTVTTLSTSSFNLSQSHLPALNVSRHEPSSMLSRVYTQAQAQASPAPIRISPAALPKYVESLPARVPHTPSQKQLTAVLSPSGTISAKFRGTRPSTEIEAEHDENVAAILARLRIAGVQAAPAAAAASSKTGSVRRNRSAMTQEQIRAKDEHHHEEDLRKLFSVGGRILVRR